VHIFENICIITKSSVRSTWTWFTNGKAIILCGDWQRLSYGQRALKSQIFNIGYCILRTKSTCTQHYVQLCTGVKCGKETAQWRILWHPFIMVQWWKTQAPKEMAAMCNFRKGICWARSCLILSLKIITLLQMRWIQTISRYHYCNRPIFQLLNK